MRPSSVNDSLPHHTATHAQHTATMCSTLQHPADHHIFDGLGSLTEGKGKGGGLV